MPPAESAVSYIDPRICSLLTDLVDAEKLVLSLEKKEIGSRRCSNERSKVTFQSFDYSTVSTPIDVKTGSDIAQKQLIQALTKVLDSIQVICGASVRADIARSVSSILTVFNDPAKVRSIEAT